MFDTPFRVGHSKFWNAHKRLYDPNHDAKDIIDLQKQYRNHLSKNPKKPLITVKKTE
jgi:hypothetical protein